MQEQTGQADQSDWPKAKTFLTITQAAERLNVAYNTIRNAVRAGKLTAYRILGTYRIDPDDLASFVAGCRVAAKGREARPPVPKATTLKHLDGARLHAAWIAQGVRVPRPGGGSARSSGSTRDPSAGTGS
jgi:excisionase family DNA binding protein